MPVAPPTGWYDSAPHWSHVYVATVITGLTSVARVTIPLTVTSFPMLSAFTSLTDSGLCREGALKWTSLQGKGSGRERVQLDRESCCAACWELFNTVCVCVCVCVCVFVSWVYAHGVAVGRQEHTHAA